MKKEDNYTHRVYVDKITEIKEIDEVDINNLLDILKKGEGEKKRNFTLDYLPIRIIEKYDFKKDNDIRKFQDLLYRCDSPIYSMVEYDSQSDIIKLINPEQKNCGCFLYRNGKLIYTNVKNVFGKSFNSSKKEYYITSINFNELLEYLMNNSKEFYYYVPESYQLIETTRENLINLMNIGNGEKILQKVKR